jgi:hypothetical protein
MSVAKLVPLLDVEDAEDNRPTLRLHADKPMIVGRNNFNTDIEKVEVSRELLKLEWRDSTLYVIPLKQKHFARVEGEVLTEEKVLNHGNVVSLYKDKYSYQVRYAEVANKASELSSDAKRRLTDHVACPICMELLVEAMIAVPCGHRFCKDCCSAETDCPTCRTKIESKVPDRLVDSLMEDLVQERCLDTDDSAAYLKRTGKEVRAECNRFMI